MSLRAGDKPDIFLERISNEIVMLKIGTIHGMLWLQTHFHDDDWDALQLDEVGLSLSDAKNCPKMQRCLDFMYFFRSIPKLSRQLY